jgi:hypothetical protein
MVPSRTCGTANVERRTAYVVIARDETGVVPDDEGD